MSETNISRRGFFGHAAGAYVLASGVTIGSVVAADPIIDAIARHRAVDDTINTMTGDEPEWEGMLDTEASAYRAVCETVPTTLDGICRKSAYMAQVGVYGIPPEHLSAALTSLATAAASLRDAA